MAKSKKPAARKRKSATSKKTSAAKSATTAASKASKAATASAATAKSAADKAASASADLAKDASKSTSSAAAKVDAPAKADTALKAASTATADVKSAAQSAKDTATSTAKSSASKAADAASTKAADVKDTGAKAAADIKKDVTEKATAKDSYKSDSNTNKTVTTPPPPAPAEKRRGGFIPLVLGGVIAGGIGYGVSEYNLLGTRSQAADYGQDIAGLTDQISGQQERIATLEAVEPPVIPEVEVPDIAPLNAQLTDLSGQMEGLTTQLEGFETRLTEIEKQPMSEGISQASKDAYERELAALQASAAEQRAEIEGLIENAMNIEKATEDAARAANVQASVAKVTAAIGAGEPFAEALGALAESGAADVPEALSAVAEDGVVTQSNLQERFPDMARAALAVARSGAEGDEAESGLGGFLKRQLGARSVAPKEGSDPDAVLSRAEAAVKDGQLDAALTEIDGLPEAAQAAMQDWLDDARARQAAQAAAADLSNSLTAN